MLKMRIVEKRGDGVEILEAYVGKYANDPQAARAVAGPVRRVARGSVRIAALLVLAAAVLSGCESDGHRLERLEGAATVACARGAHAPAARRLLVHGFRAPRAADDVRPGAAGAGAVYGRAVDGSGGSEAASLRNISRSSMASLSISACKAASPRYLRNTASVNPPQYEQYP